MRYEEKLKTGDVLHCQGNRIISRLIRKFTKSRLSHTALVIEINNTVFVVDSQRDGTHLRPFREWTNKYKYRVLIHRVCDHHPNYDSLEIRERALSVVGHKKYDFKSLLWYHPRYLLTGRWKGKKGSEAEGRFYCSEFVAWSLEYSDYYKMDPERLYQRMKVDSMFCELTDFIQSERIDPD
jgi:hypothetical protein